MPRSLKVIVSCDNCGVDVDGEDHEGAMVLTINGTGPRQVDLCSDCLSGELSKDISIRRLLLLFDTLDDLPKQPRPPATRGGVVSCGLCSATSPTSQGLGRHTKSAHSMTVAEMRAATDANGN